MDGGPFSWSTDMPMPKYLKRVIQFQPLITALVLMLTATIAIGGQPSLFKEYKGVVALDPGHGGHDSGAQGPGGTFEKDLCLDLARQLATILESTYKVILTRSDDYGVELHKRTALANHHKADLMVSLHTAASYMHATTGITIFYFQPPVDRPSPERSNVPRPPQDADLWDRIQLQHIGASRTLAKTVMQTLGSTPGLPAVHVQPAPLVVLQGAAMPAILIEIGYLTNPATEKALTSQARITAYAQALAKAIDVFMAATR